MSILINFSFLQYIGSFSYQFLTPGTYYYWSTPVDSSGLISLRGVITVVAAQSQILTVQVSSGSFTGNFTLIVRS